MWAPADVQYIKQAARGSLSQATHQKKWKKRNLQSWSLAERCRRTKYVTKAALKVLVAALWRARRHHFVAGIRVHSTTRSPAHPAEVFLSFDHHFFRSSELLALLACGDVNWNSRFFYTNVFTVQLCFFFLFLNRYEFVHMYVSHRRSIPLCPVVTRPFPDTIYMRLLCSLLLGDFFHYILFPVVSINIVFGLRCASVAAK